MLLQLRMCLWLWSLDHFSTSLIMVSIGGNKRWWSNFAWVLWCLYCRSIGNSIEQGVVQILCGVAYGVGLQLQGCQGED